MNRGITYIDDPIISLEFAMDCVCYKITQTENMLIPPEFAMKYVYHKIAHAKNPLSKEIYIALAEYIENSETEIKDYLARLSLPGLKDTFTDGATRVLERRLLAIHESITQLAGDPVNEEKIAGLLAEKLRIVNELRQIQGEKCS